MSFDPKEIENSGSWSNVTSPKRKKGKYSMANNNYAIPTQNAFEALSSEEIYDETEAETQVKKGSLQQQTSKKVKIPPIVVYSYVNTHMKTLNDIKKLLKEDFILSIKKNRIIIHTKNESDYKTFISKIKESGTEYHTYTFPEQKPLKSVLKGLAPNFTTEEIMSDLKERKKVKVTSVKQMTKLKVIPGKDAPQKVNIPVFLISFEPGVLVSEIKKIHELCYCTVTWEKHRNYNKIIQCYNCQSFGHVALNCFRKSKCKNCAGEHKSKDCADTTEDKIKCSNCGEKHTANSRLCEIYKRASGAQKRSTLSKGERTSIPINNNSSAEYQNQTKTRTHNNKLYSNVVKDSNVSENNTEYKENISIASVFSEIRSLINMFDVNKIMRVVGNTINKLKNCSDNFSKMSCIIEGVVEFFG